MIFRRCVPALLIGALSATGFAPLNLWPVTLLCFALLIDRVRMASNMRSAAGLGYAFGLGHFIIGNNWIAGAFRYQEAMPVWLGWVAVVALAFYIAVYPALAAGAAWWLVKLPSPSGEELREGDASGQTAIHMTAPSPQPSPLKGRGSTSAFIFTFAGCWALAEWLRSWVFTGYAWNPLGVVAVDVGWAARLIGTYGLSALVMLTAGSLALLARRDWRGALGSSLIVALFSFAGWVSITPPPPGPKTPVARIVQPNIAQQDKYRDDYESENFNKLASLSGVAGPEPRLLLWPEAAVPDFIGEEDEAAARARRRIATLLGPKDIVLTGADKLFKESRQRGQMIEERWIGAANSVFALNDTGHILGRYDKAHLVPYGEYLPMRPFLSAIGLSRLVPGDLDFWPGPGPRTLVLPSFGKVGVQICYEIIFSGEVVSRTERPDFLFNPSNDAWFGSFGPPQHLAQARLRALEEGMPIIRSTPTGISAVIDARGKILNALPLYRAGQIETRLPRADSPTLFARYGNRLALAFAFFLAAAGIALSRRAR
jgi:apolipoprotein N-acyltransferase